MKIFNTLRRRKEIFQPQDPNSVFIYNCGPTVYDTPTLGNWRTYVCVDLLRRTLKYFGYKVKEVINITDIEDKIIKKSAELAINPNELTEKYEKEFLEHLKILNIEKPEYMPHATDDEVIEHMIKIINELLAKGYAYKSVDGSVYFSIKKFKNYGKLSGLDKRTIKVGARVDQDEYSKDNPQDFVLWKAHKQGEPYWNAPFGKGRPGWHIECTAMSNKYLGDQIDIHAGGVDLIFPHHENEIAQTEAYTQKSPFVKYWFHVEHLLINGKRMGKSEGNAYTLKDLRDKFGVHPHSYRMLVLMSHYREKLNFTEKSIKAADQTLDNLYLFIARLNTFKSNAESNVKVERICNQAQDEFNAAISDDLNTPKALASIFTLIKKINQISSINTNDVNKIRNTLFSFDKVLGLNLSDIKAKAAPKEIIDLIRQRDLYRRKEQWAKADEIKMKIEKLGYGVQDTPNGSLPYKK